MKTIYEIPIPCRNREESANVDSPVVDLRDNLTDSIRIKEETCHQHALNGLSKEKISVNK